MKITYNSPCQFNWIKLRDVHIGRAVYFKCQFHQDMDTSDPYLKIDASAYPNRNDQGKVAVVNLKTGRLSYVDRCRYVRVIEDIEVCIND